MNISSTQANRVTQAATPKVESKRAGLQLALLQKALAAQKDTAEQLQNMAEGKGQVIDLRV